MSKNKVNELFEEINKKSGISEVIINNLDNIYVEKDGELIRIDVKFTNEDVEEFCQNLATHNRKIFNSEYPIMDGLFIFRTFFLFQYTYFQRQ